MAIQKKFKLNSQIQLSGFENELIGIVGVNSFSIKRQLLDEDRVTLGLDPSVNRWILNGIVESNIPTVIANIRINAPSGSYFVDTPYLSTNFKNNLYLRPIKKPKTNTKITSYTFSLIYKNNIETNKSSDISASLNYKTETIPVRNITIDKIDVGPPIVNNNGETRLIKVFGAPTAKFGLTLSEQVVETTTVGDSSETLEKFDKTSNKSLKLLSKKKGLSKNLFKKPRARKRSGNSSIINLQEVYSDEVSVVQGVIPLSGKFTISQKFPSNIVHRTLVNGAKSSTATIVFDNTDNVKVGDRVFATSIPSTTIIKVNTVNADGVTLVLDTAITIADNVGVHFKRKRVYSLSVVEDLTSTLSSQIPTTSPNFRLTQHMDPIITIRNSVPSGMKITHSNGVATSLGDGVDLDTSFIGRPNTTASTAKIINGITTSFEFSLLYDLNDAAETFSAVKVPVFNFLDGTNSNWTNVDKNQNGGTEVSINRAKYVGNVGLNTISLQYSFRILKWGIEDVIIDFDINNVVTIA